MLPSDIDSLLREQISTDLLVKGKSQLDVVQAALAKRGMRPPGIVSAQAQLEEIGNRSEIIADAIIKVLQDVKVSPYAGLVDDLVSLYETHYQAVIAEWKPRVLEAWNQSAGHGAGHIQSRLDAWRAEHRMEVKRRGVAIMEPITGGNVIAISLRNSHVTAIQTGDHSRIGTAINVTEQQSPELVNVLGDLAAMLMADVPMLSADKRRELREVVTEAQSEASKPNPNRIKLTAFLSMVWAGIKNIDSLKDCGQLLGQVLHGMGIDVFP